MKSFRKVVFTLFSCIALSACAMTGTACGLQAGNVNNESFSDLPLWNSEISVDTDGDGLSDYIEILLDLDPNVCDSDNNGINDGDEDFDQDSINNRDELLLGTNPCKADTDGDGLNDYTEISLSNTNPLLFDTDGDGLDDRSELLIYATDPLLYDTDGDNVSDGKEIEIGSDPTVPQENFYVNATLPGVQDSVIPSVKIELLGHQVETLTIQPIENDTFFPETMPGYMGQAYTFDVKGAFTSATVSFEFDSTRIGSDAEPVIYEFDKKTQKLNALDTVIEGNVASTEVARFSSYILVDRIVFEKAFTWMDVWESDGEYTSVEIILVVDDSGSMTSNDNRNERLSVARNLIDKLPENSKIGIVKFTSSVTKLTNGFIEDRVLSKSYLTTSYFYSSGGTNMYTAINAACSMFETMDPSVMKVMVVISDGATSDTGYHDSVISTANADNIKIYTVGLGAASSAYFTTYLKPLAESTDAAFYLAADADQLADIYKDISDKIDIETDSDNDGIPDYYEDNMVIFSGIKLKLDKNNPDTDGDGLLDGEEVVMVFEYNEDRTKVLVTGTLVSDPTKADSDGDGVIDSEDKTPFNN